MAKSLPSLAMPVCGWLLLGSCLPGSLRAQGLAAAEPRVVVGQDPAKERAAAPHRDLNGLVLAALQTMPAGGGYRTSSMALLGLRRSIQVGASQLGVDARQATPSFCSGATYLVFLSVLAQLNREGQLPLDDNALDALLVREGQDDGAGAWGRWNANGPGTARLFYEADLGRNFTSFEEARAGDFLKIFWNDEIGAREAGHSVIYLATVTRPEGQFVQYWSSNQPDGFGLKTVARQRIKRQLFSRLERPENVSRLVRLPAKDSYLASMLKRPGNFREMLRMVGAPDAEDPVLGRATSRGGIPATPNPAAGEPTPKKGFLNRLFKK